MAGESIEPNQATHRRIAADRTLETPVLIVGGGPTGHCASLLLPRFGTRSLLVERHPSVSVFSRAWSVHTQRAWWK